MTPPHSGGRSLFGRLGTVQKAAAGSLISSFGGQAALLVSGVLAARMLGVENRGYLALLVLWPTIITRLGGIGLPTSIPYYIARSPTGARSLAGRLALPAAIQTGAMLAAHTTILLFLLPGKPRPVQIAGVLTLIAAPSGLLMEYSLAFMQGQGRFLPFNILRSLQPCLYAASAAIVYLIGPRNIVVVALVLMTTALVTAVGAAVVAIQGMPVLPDTLVAQPKLAEMVRFGLKGFLGSVSPVETFRLDQAIIGLFLSPAALGLYVVGLAFTNLPRFIAQSVGLIAYPHIAGQPTTRLRKSSMLSFLVFAMALATPTVLFLAIAASRLVPFFFGNGFAGAAEVTRVLLVGALFLSARRVLSDSARGAGAPGAGTIAEIASWICLVPVALMLTPVWGVVGVAVAFATSSAVSLIVLGVALIESRVFDAGPRPRLDITGMTAPTP